MKTVVIILGIVILILLGIVLFWHPAQGPALSANTATSTLVAESVTSPDGTLTIILPEQVGVLITSPVGIEGQAKGNWFDEASFRVKILDGNGTVLGKGTAQALGNWMTTGTVAFAANIPFTTPKYATGSIVFSSDNPSGLPVNAKTFTLPVSFK